MKTQKIIFVLCLVFLSNLFVENSTHAYSPKFQKLIYSYDSPTLQLLQIVNKKKITGKRKLNKYNSDDSDFENSDSDNNSSYEDSSSDSENPQQNIRKSNSLFRKKISLEKINDFPNELQDKIINLNLDPNEIYLYNETIKNYFRNNKFDLTEKIDLIYFDENKIDEFLKHFLLSYKNKKIVNEECLNENFIFLDVLRSVSTNRKESTELKEIFEENNYEVIDLVNNDYCEHQPLKEETEEEKTIRRLERATTIERLKEQATLSNPSTDQLENEQNLWNNFFKYFLERKEEIDLGIGKKITRGEIEDTFTDLVSKKYKKFDLDNNTFYYNPDFIPMTTLDTEGRNNLRRVQDGIAPIGFDGKSMNIHHLTRHQPGIFVLISDHLHKKKSQDLHFRDKKYYLQPPEIDRNEFNQLKTYDFFPALYRALSNEGFK